jgi:hypothetical protein
MKALRAGAIVVSIGILISVVGTSVSAQPDRFDPEEDQRNWSAT